jgi:DNA repair protein RadC
MALSKRQAASQRRPFLDFLALGGISNTSLTDRLVAEFGTVAEMVAGPRRRVLHACDRDRQAAAVVLRFQRLLKSALALPTGHRVRADDEAVFAHLRLDMAFRPVECVKVLYLDTKSRLISAEVMSQGDLDYADISMRAIFARAFDLGAAGLVLVHNHPTGSPAPSNADINLTRRMAAAAKPFGITLCDHIVVAREGHCSFKQLGLI